jgi:hypothetical protein
MKKLRICLFLVFFVIGVSCFAQSGNDAQRIVGTWIIEGGGDNIVFNSNGTFSGTLFGNGKYFFNSGKLILSSGFIFDIFLSSDNRVLFIVGRTDIHGAWLNKQ